MTGLRIDLPRELTRAVLEAAWWDGARTAFALGLLAGAVLTLLILSAWRKS